MPSQNSYRDQLKQDMIDIIDQLELPDLQKTFMKSRWLDQLLWLESRAERFRNHFYRLRITTIIGGVIVPALVSLNLSGDTGQIFKWSAFGISQAVAISAGLEEFFRYGERWYQYRNTAEGLKIEGWQFFQLSGPYQSLKTHAEAYTAFASRVEFLIKKDVAIYVSEGLQQGNKEKEEKGKKEEKVEGSIQSQKKQD